ncbi:MAG: phosphoglucosamine mutase [Acidobacteriota bacterium]|nr:phosphoglucosamine mutase [Acidobacteriota bacterium]MDE3093447.1 phosphoglucosamine mutase [Acidobacteriota bacterium]MDE3139897.1 phosphoglucosamine mutase [Acidobacteriota bacterium]MDE3146204.1 phosphoglucosamine mutase [Acidobacteriota bacterium]
MHFGTDGIRGRAYEEITVDLAYRLGRAVGSVFSVPVFVGYDTRESSPVLALAVLAGLADAGAQGHNLGVFTTPGVAVIAKARGGAGIVVSASHNPYYDNGLKVLGVGGAKLDFATEAAVEEALNRAAGPSREVFEDVEVDRDAQHEYAEHLRRLVPVDLSGLHLVLDCANGAASHVAHELFEGTGARVTTLFDAPNGTNINLHCGSTHPEDLRRTVVELGADVGLAFDGDADRLIAVDARGVLRNGDDLAVLFSLDSHARGELEGVVVTVMSNLGVHRALGARGVKVVETDVGDRNILAALEERRWDFGAEQSGHLIFRRLSPTGDGLLTGLLVADLVARFGPLAEQCDAAWQRVPQDLINIATDAYDDAVVRAMFDEECREMSVASDDVRLLIRRSGTEPLIRVMVEALDEAFVGRFTTRVRTHFSQ